MKRDFTRTIAAIKAYDEFDTKFEASGTQKEVLKKFAELERLASAVGEAFGLDTSDINSVDTCRACICPGPRVPGPGAHLSFVRRMVAK
jgi:hypothetical protein